MAQADEPNREEIFEDVEDEGISDWINGRDDIFKAKLGDLYQEDEDIE